jgi:DNA-binding transcriptional ArsR family regulator
MPPRLDLDTVFAALAHQGRRQVLADLAVMPVGAERACGSFDLPVHKATRTHHFRVLRDAGLIDQHHHGNGSTISLRRDAIETALPGLLNTLIANRAHP